MVYPKIIIDFVVIDSCSKCRELARAHASSTNGRIHFQATGKNEDITIIVTDS